MDPEVLLEQDVSRNVVKLRREFIWRLIEEDSSPGICPPILTFIYTEKGEYLGSKHVPWCPCDQCVYSCPYFLSWSRKNLHTDPDKTFDIEKGHVYWDARYRRHFHFCECKKCDDSPFTQAARDYIIKKQDVLRKKLQNCDEEERKKIDMNWIIGLATKLEYMNAGFNLLTSLHDGCRNMPKTYELSMIGEIFLRANEVCNLDDYMASERRPLTLNFNRSY